MLTSGFKGNIWSTLTPYLKMLKLQLILANMGVYINILFKDLILVFIVKPEK